MEHGSKCRQWAQEEVCRKSRSIGLDLMELQLEKWVPVVFSRFTALSIGIAGLFLRGVGHGWGGS